MRSEVPEGWRSVRFREAASLSKGLTYKASELVASGTPFVTIKCFAKGGGFRDDGVKAFSGDVVTKHVVRPGDVLVANTDLTRAGDIIGSAVRVPLSIGELALISMDVSRLDRMSGVVDDAFLCHFL